MLLSLVSQQLLLILKAGFTRDWQQWKCDEITETSYVWTGSQSFLRCSSQIIALNFGSKFKKQPEFIVAGVPFPC